jgi:hypothetical protein
VNIKSVEPTPSPNTMKLNMDEHLPNHVRLNYTRETQDGAPAYLKQILSVPGVKSVFQSADFIAVERTAKADWQAILSGIRNIFGDGGETGSELTTLQPGTADSYGEVKVMVQMFKGIPLQVKLLTGTEEKRFALPPRFADAIMRAQSPRANYIFERKWMDKGVRYGEPEAVGDEVVQELSAVYDDRRLADLVSLALKTDNTEQHTEEHQPAVSGDVMVALDEPDWEKRFAALERINPTKEDIPLLNKALQDPKSSIRRLAVVYLGLIGGDEVLPLLFQALKDKAVAVRRTAGDTLSDLGNPKAIGAMIEALSDPNKLVRWRAARFLYEIGDESAIPALFKAQNDPEFEVRMQAKMALERIEKGEKAAGTVWQQMARRAPNSD